MQTKKSARQKASNFNAIQFLVEPTKIQKQILNFFRSNQISCLTGDPGTGKTFMAVYYALLELSAGACDKIVITKPLVEVGKSMGFLPGTKEEKMSDYKRSYEQIFETILGPALFQAMIASKKIIFEPINFCRGNTIAYARVILDEAQNLTLHELVSFITRIADTSKTMVIGDDWQSDIKDSGFMKFTNLFSSVDGIDYMHLGEEFQMRSSMITEMYKIYKDYLSK